MSEVSKLMNRFIKESKKDKLQEAENDCTFLPIERVIYEMRYRQGKEIEIIVSELPDEYACSKGTVERHLRNIRLKMLVATNNFETLRL